MDNKLPPPFEPVSPIEEAKLFYASLAPHIKQRESAEVIVKLIEYAEILEMRLLKRKVFTDD